MPRSVEIRRMQSFHSLPIDSRSSNSDMAAPFAIERYRPVRGKEIQVPAILQYVRGQILENEHVGEKPLEKSRQLFFGLEFMLVVRQCLSGRFLDQGVAAQGPLDCKSLLDIRENRGAFRLRKMFNRGVPDDIVEFSFRH